MRIIHTKCAKRVYLCQYLRLSQLFVAFSVVLFQVSTKIHPRFSSLLGSSFGFCENLKLLMRLKPRSAKILINSDEEEENFQRSFLCDRNWLVK